MLISAIGLIISTSLGELSYLHVKQQDNDTLIYTFANGKWEEEKAGQIMAREKYLPNIPGKGYGGEEANRELDPL